MTTTVTARNSELYREKFIMAPMVKIGTLPSRLLALRCGADLVYTEEIIDWRLLNSKRIPNGIVEYIDQSDGTVIFSTCEEEKSKVILQMGTCDPDRATRVVQLVNWRKLEGNSAYLKKILVSERSFPQICLRPPNCNPTGVNFSFNHIRYVDKP